MITQIIQKCKNRKRKKVTEDLIKPRRDQIKKKDAFEESKDDITQRDLTKMNLADLSNSKFLIGKIN